jgi:hypothetical protein
LGNSTPVNGDGIPKTIPLPLGSEEKVNCLKTRFQTRSVKSIRLGRVSLKYERGKTSEGRPILPPDLEALVPTATHFSYDTILLVTKMRFQLFMQREEIQQHSALTNGFHISTGSVSNLSWMGLAYLEHCHFAQAKKLAERYRKNGFFIHLDGTNEGGKYTHFVVREGMSGNVLYADKIVSESELAIVPILKKVKELFGQPEAVISDLSAAIRKAVRTVFKNVPHLLCHFHFLKDVGKDMLQDLHQRLKYSIKDLQKQLKEFRGKFDTEQARILGKQSKKQTKIYEHYSWLISMIDRINDHEKDLSGEGFPFDLTHLAFYDRCQQVYASMEHLLTTMEKSGELKKMGRNISTNLWLIRNTIQKFLERLSGSISQLSKVNTVFMELRDLLHPKTKTDRTPLNWGMLDDKTNVENIEQKLTDLRKKAEKKVKAKVLPKYEYNAWKIIHTHLKKHGKLLNPEIKVKGKTLVLPRTNNLSETAFRDAKRKARRTTGKKNLSRHMDELPSQYFYIVNLDDTEYVTTVFGDKEPYDCFHKIDKEEIKKTMETMKAQRGSPKAIDYKLIRNEDYLTLLTNHFSDHAVKKKAG